MFTTCQETETNVAKNNLRDELILQSVFKKMTLILTRVTQLTKILASSSLFKQELQVYVITFTISGFRLNLIWHINKMK